MAPLPWYAKLERNVLGEMSTGRSERVSHTVPTYTFDKRRPTRVHVRNVTYMDPLSTWMCAYTTR